MQIIHSIERFISMISTKCDPRCSFEIGRLTYGRFILVDQQPTSLDTLIYRVRTRDLGKEDIIYDTSKSFDRSFPWRMNFFKLLFVTSVILYPSDNPLEYYLYLICSFNIKYTVFPLEF